MRTTLIAIAVSLLLLYFLSKSTWGGTILYLVRGSVKSS